MMNTRKDTTDLKLDISSLKKHNFTGASDKQPKSSTFSSRGSMSARVPNFKIESKPTLLQTSNGLDINMQACLRNFYNVEKQAERDFGEQIIVNKSNVRSLNLAMNSILKVPEGIFKSILVLNISMNKLKSLNGIEECSRL